MIWFLILVFAIIFASIKYALKKDKESGVAEEVSKNFEETLNTDEKHTLHDDILKISDTTFPKQIVLSMQATGDSIKDEVLQISIIDFSRILVLNAYCRPIKHSVWKDAEKYHQISPDDLFKKNKYTLKDWYDTLKTILEGVDEIVGIDANYDLNFINDNIRRCGLNKLNIHAKVCDVNVSDDIRHGQRYNGQFEARYKDLMSQYRKEQNSFTKNLLKTYRYTIYNSVEECRNALVRYKLVENKSAEKEHKTHTTSSDLYCKNTKENNDNNDNNYISVIEKWLRKRHKLYFGYQAYFLSLRHVYGKTFSTSDHIRAFIYTLLSPQGVLSRNDLAEIKKLFFDFDPQKILDTPQEYFYNGLEKLGHVSMLSNFMKNQMECLHYNIQIMLFISQKYGSLDDFVLSHSPKELVACLATNYKGFKLKKFEERLAYEYLRYVGIDCCNPNVNIMRFFGTERMGNGLNFLATTEEAIEAVDKLSCETNKSKFSLEKIILLFCDEVCGATPKCDICPIQQECKKGRSFCDEKENSEEPVHNEDEKDKAKKIPKRVVLDTETTGISNSDEILQVSILDEDGKIIFNEYCKPIQHTLWREAEKIHHISPAMAKDKKPLSDFYAVLKEILEGVDEIIGFNTKFDIRMLKNNLAMSGHEINIHAKIVDVMQMYRCRYGSPYKLVDCAKHFGYSFVAHDSIEDCRATLFCYKKMSVR